MGRGGGGGFRGGMGGPGMGFRGSGSPMHRGSGRPMGPQNSNNIPRKFGIYMAHRLS